MFEGLYCVDVWCNQELQTPIPRAAQSMVGYVGDV
jgi:hypothetical protein